ncbi:LysR family transcriptional regulator [Cedecea sp. NFIX57]|uniref:LysR family transcriptional regulator n=1 Tax=Cedecea sp. NFIX57 TaxID=1566286 RepID=UPI000A0991B2|nr:LysR family transcriptional regulator [Cedecea sp. NFIX57]SMG59506.1 DNA-binding transcriptional regulator, LysR family [Cedecea sp. NFIX57]
MDLFRAMTVFAEVAKAGSMSAASRKLHITPAMVGQHIAALEDRLGMRLLNRTTRRQKLTDFGRSYLEQCHDILERVAISETQAEGLQHSFGGKLRLTAAVSFGTECLIPALQRYRKMAPDVEIEITLTDSVIDLVDEGIDIAFRIGELDDSSMIGRPLMPYRMAVCASPNYLNVYGTPEHPSELIGHQLLSLSTSSRSPWKLSRGEEKVEIPVESKLTVNNGQALRMAARSGLGIVMQPEILLSEDIISGRLVRLFQGWHIRERQVWLLYLRNKRMTPKIRAFINFSLEEFSSGNV